MRRIAPLVLIVVACVGPVETTTTIDPMESRPDCPQAGEILTEDMVENGCMDGNTLSFPGVWDCEDGRQLWGEDDLWGWVGETVIQSEGDSAADPAYAAAYEECNP